MKGGAFPERENTASSAPSAARTSGSGTEGGRGARSARHGVGELAHRRCFGVRDQEDPTHVGVHRRARDLGDGGDVDDALAVAAAVEEHEPAPRDGANHRLDVALVAAPEDRAEAEHGRGEEAPIGGVEDELLGRDLGARIRAVPDDRGGLVEERRAGLFAVDLDGADEDQPFDAGRLARSEERACPPPR